jgi:hypothetical protein
MSVFVRCGLRGLSSVLFVLAIGSTTPLSAQVRATGLDRYRHPYDRERGYVPVPGGYGPAAYGYGLGAYGYGASTAAEGAGIGLGQAAEGLGQMHLSNAQAAGAYEDAVNQFLQNKGLAMQTVQQNASERHAADEQWQAKMKEQARAQSALHQRTLEQMSAAHRLTAEQFDMDRGVLHWPFVLRSPEYAELRNKLDVLYDARTPEDSGKNSGGYSGIVAACEALQKMVKEDAKKGMSVTDYVTATHFVSSIEYESQFRVKATTASPPQVAASVPQ